MLKYTIFGFIAIVLWSTTVGLAGSLTKDLGALPSASLVQLIGGIVCLIPCLKSHGLSSLRPRSGRYILLCGTTFVFYMTLIYQSLGSATNDVQVLEIGLINYLWTAFTILFSLILLPSKSNWLIIPGTILAIAGVYLVLSGENAQGIGQIGQGFTQFLNRVSQGGNTYLFPFFAAICWALYSVCARRYAHIHYEGALGSFMLLTAVILGLSAGQDMLNIQFSTKSLGELAALGISSGIAYSLWDLAMRKGNVIVVVAASYFIPFTATVFSSLYLDVPAGPYIWWGCALIIVGSILSWRGVKVTSATG